MRSRSLTIAVVAAALLAGCGDEEEDAPEQSDTAEQAATTESGTAEAQAVLEGVIDRDINDPAYHGGGFRSDPALSPALIDQIAAIEAANRAEGFPGLGFDPFLCAQQIPAATSFRPVGEVGDQITFIGRLEFGGATEKVSYVMALEGGKWQLLSTECVDAAQPKGE